MRNLLLGVLGDSLQGAWRSLGSLGSPSRIQWVLKVSMPVGACLGGVSLARQSRIMGADSLGTHKIRQTNWAIVCSFVFVWVIIRVNGV